MIIFCEAPGVETGCRMFKWPHHFSLTLEWKALIKGRAFPAPANCHFWFGAFTAGFPAHAWL